MYYCFRWIASIALSGLLGTACASTAQPAIREPDFGWASMERPTDAAFARKAPVYALGAAARVDVYETRRFALICRIAPPKDGPREGELWRMALSPDGKRLVMAWQNGTRLWDARTGKPLARLPGGAEEPFGLAWSDDGRLIAAGGERKVRIWNAATGKTVRDIPVSGAVSFSADGRLLAIAGDNSAYVYRVADGRLVRSFTPKEGVFGPVAFSPDARLLITGGEDPDWHEAPLPRDKDGNEYSPTEAFYAHDLKLHVWNVKTGHLVRYLPGGRNQYRASGARFAPDGKHVFTTDSWGAYVYDIRTGHQLRFLQGDGPAALSGDVRLIALGRRFYSVATGKRIATLPGMPLPIASLAFSRDGQLLLASDRQTVRLWSTSPARFRFAWIPTTPGNSQPGVFFLPSGDAAVNALNATDVWNTATGKRTATLRGPVADTGIFGRGRPFTVLSPDGKMMLTGSGGPFIPGALEIRDAATTRIRHTIPAQSVAVAQSAYSPNSRYFVAPTGFRPKRRGLSVFDLTTVTVVSMLADAPVYPATLIFSPDSRSIAGSRPADIRMPDNVQLGDNRLMLWDAATGEVRADVITIRPVKAIAFSPDGTTLATAEGPDIVLRDPATLEKRGEIPMAEAEVSALAFAPNGKTLAAGDEAGRIRVVSVPDGAVRLVFIGVPSDAKGAPTGWALRDETGAWRKSAATPHAR